VAPLVLVALASAGCGARVPEAAGPPPIPSRSGSLLIDVVYPPDGSLITARDSNFIFGSVGDGSARLTINGQDVPVEPNGAFLAWLPVPSAANDTLADYRLVARLGDREVRAVHTVRLRPPSIPLPADSALVDAMDVSPRGAWWVRAGEVVPVRLRASPGAQVRLLLPDGDTVALAEAALGTSGSAANWIFGAVPSADAGARPLSGIYAGELMARSPLGRGGLNPEFPPVPAGMSAVEPYCAPRPRVDSMAVVVDTIGDAADTTASPRREEAAVAGVGGAAAGTEEGAGVESPFPEDCAVIEVALANDTMRTPLPLDLWILEEPGPVVELREEPSGVGRDGFVVGRAAPGATTLWMWTDGVQGRVTGRRNDSVRLALDGKTEAWVALDELVRLRGVTLPARASVGTVRFDGRPDRLRVRIAVGYPVPYQVEVDDRRLTLVLYGAYSNTNWLRYGAQDPFLRGAGWEQVASDRYLLHVDLASRPWGYRVRYEGRTLVLDIRKPPSIDEKRPLAGRRIAVDPGHPPGGATGPTRLYEGDANLAVAFWLKRLLEKEGATVVMTRADRSPVRLYDRTPRAEILNAEILVSIHNNALPDGVNPFENNGTSVYYFQPQSLDLARALQRGLLEAMGLTDLGIGRASLALARPAWMPAALTEGAFMMIPDQEAGLRDPAFQEAYARGVLEGLREFLRERVE
jgi:N-acetylmuramoyl-L-alanine amidase